MLTPFFKWILYFTLNRVHYNNPVLSWQRYVASFFKVERLCLPLQAKMAILFGAIIASWACRRFLRSYITPKWPPATSQSTVTLLQLWCWSNIWSASHLNFAVCPSCLRWCVTHLQAANRLQQLCPWGCSVSELVAPAGANGTDMESFINMLCAGTDSPSPVLS